MEERFVALLKAGAEARMPARMAEAREQLIRARREHAGGLVGDAEISLGAVDRILWSIERDMKGGLSPPRRLQAEG
jgi:hypothetical protein